MHQGYFLYGASEIIGLLEFRFALYVAYISVPAGQDVAEIFPVQVPHQVVVVQQRSEEHTSELQSQR